MNSNEPISRRKFLAITSTAVAALVLGACVKLEPTNSVLQPISSTPEGEAVSAAASTPAAAQIAEPTAAQTTQATQVSQVQASGFRCPKNLVDDPYPGRCRHYRDDNGNGYCDYSQG